MAFQTNVLRGGEWVTQTIDLQAVLKASTAARPPKQRFVKPPKCGIITRTVVESPVAHLILPVRLRSAQHDDVAFVGDHFVQIRELRTDGQLQDIILKNDFGVRIRTAKVIGTAPEHPSQPPDINAGFPVKTEADGDIDMLSLHSSRASSTDRPPDIAPQMLLVVLENGDCIFMILRTSLDGTFKFVTSQFELPYLSRVQYPGFHLAVDPSSRYVALGCAEEFFLVYELESWEVLNQRYQQNEPLEPIKRSRPRRVNGVIHKMDFLFPRREDDYHIILLLIIVKDCRSRMVIYEWEAGEELSRVLSQEKRGHRLPVEHQMPLLLIPLMVRTAFFAVYENSIAVGKDVLVGPPNFETFDIEDQPASRFHHGKQQPLWAAWARPYRLPLWNERAHDSIYLAREDGVVQFLDIDGENILGASQVLSNLECNISSAFCCLFDPFADILLVGGDSGPGAVWKVFPRIDPEKLGPIPNWSPAVDLVTTDEFSSWDQESSALGSKMVPWSRRSQDVYRAPDRVFAASGRGATGTVTEYRHGLQANIGVELECEPTTTQTWLFPVDPNSVGSGYHLLMSMPYHSTLWKLSDDLGDPSEPMPHEDVYDRSSRTIAASRVCADSATLQITENYAVCVSPKENVRILLQDFTRANQTPVSHATILDDTVVMSTSAYKQSNIHVLRVESGLSISISAVKSIPVEGEVTCLSSAIMNGTRRVFVGLWKDDAPCLAHFSLDNLEVDHLEFIHLNLPAWIHHEAGGTGHNTTQEDQVRSFEAYTSIVAMDSGAHSVTLVLGTHNGEVLTVVLHDTEPAPSVLAEKFGLTAATLLATSFRGQPAVLVCCSSALMFLTDFDAGRSRSFKTKHRVWPVDTNDPGQPSPPIHSVAVLDGSLTQQQDHIPLLLVAGSRLLIAELLPQAKAVPRSIPLYGTPQKLFYSHHLECLVVAVCIGDRPTLKFLDPNSGEDLSRPTDKNGEDVEFISGLGNPQGTILGLSEWEYKKDGKVWGYILASTNDGHLLVISTEKEMRSGDLQPHLTTSTTMATHRIRYWTRYKRPKGPVNTPVYSVLGHSDGLIYCVGSTIHWDILDLAEKKLKPMKTFELRSPATALRMVNDKIVALTCEDSVAIIHPAVEVQSSQEMVLEHVDPRARSAMHMIEVGGIKIKGNGSDGDNSKGNDDGDDGASILLLCDNYNGIAGLWVPWQQPGRDCDVVLEAELPASVRKFCRGRTRPSWLHARRGPAYGALASTVDGAEVLGLCLDGSLQHFSLVGMEAWAVLRLVQNLALESPLICPFTCKYAREASEWDPSSDPHEPQEDAGFEMQIDGDVLSRCLERRALKELFEEPRLFDRLEELLGELVGPELLGKDGSGGDGSGGGSSSVRPPASGGSGLGVGNVGAREKCFEMVYDILEYYLAPVL